MSPYLIAVHVLANVVWIGSILAVARLLTLRNDAVGLKERGELALNVYRTLANPAFMASFLLGGIQLGLNAQHYFVTTKFMHGKLLLVFVIIGLHHVIGARARKVAQGKADSAGPAWPLALALLACAAGTIVLATAKPF